MVSEGQERGKRVDETAVDSVIGNAVLTAHLESRNSVRSALKIENVYGRNASGCKMVMSKSST